MLAIDGSTTAHKFIESDGDARCWLLLDAFELFCEGSSKSMFPLLRIRTTTVKWLGGTDPIGCPWGATVPDGNPGRASDVLVTNDTKILRHTPKLMGRRIPVCEFARTPQFLT